MSAGSNARIQTSGSPSSRRVWIEILCVSDGPPVRAVALLTEGVDRNTVTRRAEPVKEVALLTEGVDGNLCEENQPAH